ncbi:MAG: homocysteine biosynthesis protein [Desulfitobacteriaceae bacterium]|nr:homocysteine biosynthesis protein [Desulfitobacteriaceae bacterium]
MGVEKTYAEINARIKSGQAVVVTADELITIVKEKGLSQATREVDVVTTGTFAPMCSSGAFLSLGHTTPRMKMQKVWLNGVPAYSGLAAVDAYIGATEVPEDDPLNGNYPGEFRYGGGHVIQDLVARKPIRMKALAYGTDCYPRREIDTTITIDSINEATLFNPRNAYQNYNCAVNLTDRIIYTYMGMLKPRLGNAHYSTSGQLSPLLKDPNFQTIGIGTRIFLGGGIGYIAWHGTQHFPSIQSVDEKDLGPAGGTLAVIGDLKQMSPRWLVGTSYLGYGATLSVGIGVPIPILNEEIARYAAATDEELFAPIVDYGDDYPSMKPGNLGFISYADLKSGEITVNGRKTKTAPLSSLPRAREIASTLKNWILECQFLINEPVQLLPSPTDGLKSNTLKG